MLMSPIVRLHSPLPGTSYLGGTDLLIACTCGIFDDGGLNRKLPSSLLFEIYDAVTEERLEWLDAARGGVGVSALSGFHHAAMPLPSVPSEPRPLSVRATARFDGQPAPVEHRVAIRAVSPTEVAQWTSAPIQRRPTSPTLLPSVLIPKYPAPPEPLERHKAGRSIYVEGATKGKARWSYLHLFSVDFRAGAVINDQIVTDWDEPPAADHYVKFRSRLASPGRDLLADEMRMHRILVYVRDLVGGAVTERSTSGPIIEVTRD